MTTTTSRLEVIREKVDTLLVRTASGQDFRLDNAQAAELIRSLAAAMDTTVTTLSGVPVLVDVVNVEDMDGLRVTLAHLEGNPLGAWTWIRKLPANIRYNGVTLGFMGWNSDRGQAYYWAGGATDSRRTVGSR